MIDQNGSIFTIMLYNMEIGTKRMFSLAAVNNQGELWHSWHVDVIGMLINLSNCMKCHKLWFRKNFSANLIQLIWLLLDCNEKLQPPSFVSSPSNIFFKRGENVNLQFQVLGFPEPRLDFYNNGKLLRNNEVYTIGTFT